MNDSKLNLHLKYIYYDQLIVFKLLASTTSPYFMFITTNVH